jgi:PKD repeat protein
MNSHIRSPTRRLASTVVTGALATTALILMPATAARAATTAPSGTPTGIIRTSPFSNGGIMADDEGSSYVKRDDALWLVQDTGKIFEVDAATGERRRTITSAELQTVPATGGAPGAPPATAANFSDMESIAYDASKDILYVFSGSNTVGQNIPTVFRLTRQGDSLQLLDYQVLPTPDTDFTAAAWNPVDGQLYVGKGSQLQTYDFATNTAGAPFGVGVSGILGLDFSPDGSEMFVARTKASDPREVQVVDINWPGKDVAWRLDVQAAGVKDARGVAYVDGALYVSDGFDDPSNPPNEHAVYIFGQRASTPIAAHIKADVASGAAPLAVHFSDVSTGSPTEWRWSFGDGATSAERNPSHTFANPGTYAVKLVASSLTNYDETTTKITVKDVTAPTATYAVPAGTVVAGSTTVKLEESGLTDDFTPTAEIQRSVAWGDGATSATLTHVYGAAGSYKPMVTLTDNAGNSRTIAAGTVTVTPATPATPDIAGPVVKLQRPANAASVRAWRVLRGSAVDAGSGVRSVTLRLVEKRGRTWYAYRATTKSWVSARTQAAALKRSRQAVLTPATSTWSYTVQGLRKGYLVVKVAGTDNAGNASSTRTYTQRLTRR